MPTDTEQLVVSLEARIRDFERNFQRANRTANQNFKAIEDQAKRSADALEQSMSKASQGVNVALAGLKGGIAGLVTGLSIGALEGILSRVGDITKEIANVGNEAKRAGLSARAFQELGYVAQQNRIPIDALTDGMKELSLRADEFLTTGKGSAAESFQRLGYTADDLKRKLADPSALLVDIVSKMENLDKAAQIRIADELFGGTGGERFVELLDRGADGIRKLIREANELGLIMDDEVIARADELDRKFNAIGTTVSTYTKQAILGLVGAADDVLDRFNKIDEQSTRNVQDRLVGVYDKLNEAKARLDDLGLEKTAFPGDVAVDLNIDRQKQLIEDLTNEAMKLRDILDRRNGLKDNFIYQTGEDAKATTPSLENLYGALNSTGSSAASGAKGLNTFADAIRALKMEIPGLADNLALLDAKARIEDTYKAALNNARTMSDVYMANELRGKALSSLNIKSATDDPTKYLSNILASGKNAQHVTGMQSAFQQKLATMLASMPDDLKGSVSINSGYRSPERQQELWLEALRKYGSPEAARKWVAPPGNSQHNKGYAADLGYRSDAARNWVHQNAGTYGLSFPLGNEDWHIEDEDARGKARAQEIQTQTNAMMQQSTAYKAIIADAQQFTQGQQTEQQALTMTQQAAAAYRYEQQMLNDAQRQGISVTPQQRAEIQQLAQGMAQAEAATNKFAQTQQNAAEFSQMLGNTAVDALTGIITGTTTAEQALAQLGQQLIKVALQAALLGEGPLAGGGGSSSGGLFGGLLGFLFRARGGLVSTSMLPHMAGGGGVRGPGTSTSDSIPTMLSDGEFVVNARAADKHRAVLEAINSGHAPAMADGGLVGNTKSRSGGSLTTVFAPQINVQASGSSGDPAKDDAHAKNMAKEVSKAIDQQMTDWTIGQMRPGGLLSGYGKR